MKRRDAGPRRVGLARERAADDGASVWITSGRYPPVENTRVSTSVVAASGGRASVVATP